MLFVWVRVPQDMLFSTVDLWGWLRRNAVWQSGKYAPLAGAGDGVVTGSMMRTSCKPCLNLV